MTNVLTMNWTNESAEAFSFYVEKVQHGNAPTPSPASMPAASGTTYGSDAVTAEQSSNLTPGPEGEYEWQAIVSTDLTLSVVCSYHFPAGSSGELVQVTLKPESSSTKDGSLEVSFDGSTWSSNEIDTSWTSTGTQESVACYVRDATS